MAWEWLNALLNSKPAVTAMAAGNGVIKGSKPIIKAGTKAIPVIGNYLTGQSIGNHLATITGADNPDEIGYMAGAANTVLMPLTGIFGEAFDTGYGIGEILDELSGASKFYGDLLSQWDPQGVVKQSLWDKERTQDPEWIAAKQKYLERKNAQNSDVSAINISEGQPDIENAEQPKVEIVKQPSYDTEALVNSIIRGDYDNGAERIKKLTKLGLTLNQIGLLQKAVNQRMRIER